MREKIIMIILLISIILVAVLAIFGLKIGNLQILSISQLIDKNKEVNNQIDLVNRKTTVDYPQAIQQLEATVDSLNIEKEKYEQLAGFENEKEPVYETEQYDVGYLWTKLGKYATKNNISLVMDIKKASGTNLYNLNFTLQGEYVDISQFITTIENDSELSYRIYNFKLVPGASDVKLKATFVVKDVNIDDSSLIKSNTIDTTKHINSANTTQTASDDPSIVE